MKSTALATSPVTRRAFFALAGGALLVPQATIFLPPRGGWPVFTDRLGLQIYSYMVTLWVPQDFEDIKRQVAPMPFTKWQVTAEQAAEFGPSTVIVSTVPDWPPRRA